MPRRDTLRVKLADLSLTIAKPRRRTRTGNWHILKFGMRTIALCDVGTVYADRFNADEKPGSVLLGASHDDATCPRCRSILRQMSVRSFPISVQHTVALAENARITRASRKSAVTNSPTATEKSMLSATIDKPAAAVGGGGFDAETLKRKATLLWHIRGQVLLPKDLAGAQFKQGTLHPGFVCCRCGGVELTEFAWGNNHGCCSSVVPSCTRPSSLGRTGGWAEQWQPGGSDLLAMTGTGGLRAGDVFALPHQRKPYKLVRDEVKSSREPNVALLHTEGGDVLEVNAFAAHTLELLARGSVTQPLLLASAARSVHTFIPLAGNFQVCGECGRGNHQYHRNNPNGPGRYVPAVAAPTVQPVPDPGSHEGFRKLVGDGILNDLSGRPLHFVDCVCKRGKVSGMTCPREMPCPGCGVVAGKPCVRPGEDVDLDIYHSLREWAAEEDMRRREAAGDLSVPARWPGKTPKTTKKEAATVKAPTNTGKIRWNSYRGADAVLGVDLQPGETIRCPVSGCDRQAKIRRDGKVGAHKMHGAQTCRTAGEKIPDDVSVDVLSRRHTAHTSAAAEAQTALDGMADLLQELAAGGDVTPVVDEADTTPLPVVYQERQQLNADRKKHYPEALQEVRVDEFAALREQSAHRGDGEPDYRSWVIASEDTGTPARHVWSMTKLDGPGQVSQDGTTMWELHTLVDGERGSKTGIYQLYGSQKITIQPGGCDGWRPGMFHVDERAEVRLKHEGPWLRAQKITWGGLFVKGQKPIVAWSDIYQVRKWGNEIHSTSHEMLVRHGIGNPGKHFGFDGGAHEFVATHAGSLRCRVCLDSIRTDLHTGVLNADFQGFEQLRQKLLDPGNTNLARQHLTGQLDRYVRGLPLVRHDRDRDVQWNFICPIPGCESMHIGWGTRRAIKAGWFRHVDQKHADLIQPDSWGKTWQPTWDDKAFPSEPGIVWNGYTKPSRSSVEKPVALKVVVPRDDPSWERLVAKFEQEGRSMSLEPASTLNRHAVMTIMFNEGGQAAGKFRGALHDAGFSYSDIEKSEQTIERVPLAECLATVHDPKLIDRSTGSVRDPENMFIFLTKEAMAELYRMPQVPGGFDQPVKLVIVHDWSAKAVVLGPFADWKAADDWWGASCNKMAKDPNVDARMFPIKGGKRKPKAAAEPAPVAVAPVAVADTLPGLDDMLAAMDQFTAGLTPPVVDLDAELAALLDTAAAAVTGPAEVLLTEVPLGSYIEVLDRLKETTRRGFLIEAPRVHTAGWGADGDFKDEPYLRYTLGNGSTVTSMYSPVFARVTVMTAPADAAAYCGPNSETRPMCVSDLRPGDVVSKGGLKQKTRDGEVTVLGRPILVNPDEVRIRIQVGGRDTSARVDRLGYTQVTTAAAYATGDELPLSVESQLQERDLRALHDELGKILGSYNRPNGEAPSQAMLLWAAGAMRLRSGFYFWKSWHAGDQMATYLPKTKVGQHVGAGDVWFECDKGGFVLYPSLPGSKTEARAMRQKLQVTEHGWDQVLGFLSPSRVPAEIRQLIEDLMADREACSPGRGYTEEHLSPVAREAESLAEQSYRMGVDLDLTKAAMEAWCAVRPS